MFETAQIDQILPSSYEAGWYLEAIEACDSTLVYEGFANLKNLTSLTYLDLSYCPKIDTWCMDRITGEYADTLEYLDLSGCKNLQSTSLEPIWRLSKLKTLVLRDMVSRKYYFVTKAENFFLHSNVEANLDLRNPIFFCLKSRVV